MENKGLKRKLRILEKAINAGMTSDKAFSDLSAQDYFVMQKLCKFNSADNEEFFRLLEAIRKKELISYLAKQDESKEVRED